LISDYYSFPLILKRGSYLNYDFLGGFSKEFIKVAIVPPDDLDFI